jgi:hypothetical protein
MNDTGLWLEPFCERLPLLAENEPWSQIASRVRHDSAGIYPHLHDWLLPLAVVACAGFAVWLLARQAQRLLRRWLHNHPGQLFGQLCRAHRLDWTQRRLLRRLAKSHGMAHPVRLFLEPERFTSAASNPELQPFLDPLDRLRRKLFCAEPD